MITSILTLALAAQIGGAALQQVVRGIDLDNCKPYIVSTDDSDPDRRVVRLTIICHKQGEEA